MQKTSLEKYMQGYYVRTLIIGVIISIALVFVPTVLFDKLENDIASFLPLAVYALAGIVAVVFGLIPLAMIILRPNKNVIKKTMDEHGLSEEQALNECKTADKYNGIEISNHFTFVKKNLQYIAVPNDDIVWVYERQLIKNGKTSYYLIIRTIKKKEYTSVFYKEQTITKCVNDYSHFPHILLGYDKEYQKLYRSRFSEFLKIQYYKES